MKQEFQVYKFSFIAAAALLASTAKVNANELDWRAQQQQVFQNAIESSLKIELATMPTVKTDIAELSHTAIVEMDQGLKGQDVAKTSKKALTASSAE